jgi:hypothetical protein
MKTTTWDIGLTASELAYLSPESCIDIAPDELALIVGGAFTISGAAQAFAVGGVSGMISGSLTGAAYGAFGGTIALPGGGTVVGAGGGFLVGGIFGGFGGAIGGLAGYIAYSMVNS